MTPDSTAVYFLRLTRLDHWPRGAMYGEWTRRSLLGPRLTQSLSPTLALRRICRALPVLTMNRVQSSLASLTACLTFLFLSFLTVKRREGCLPRHKRQGRQRSSSNTTSIAASRRQTFKKTSSAAVIDVSGRLRPSLQLRHAERSLGRRQPSPRILEGSGAHGAWDRWRRWKPWERHASAAVLVSDFSTSSSFLGAICAFKDYRITGCQPMKLVLFAADAVVSDRFEILVYPFVCFIRILHQSYGAKGSHTNDRTRFQATRVIPPFAR